MVAEPERFTKKGTVLQDKKGMESGEKTKMTGELASAPAKKLLVMTVIQRVKELQPINEKELIAQLSVGEPYLSEHKAAELVMALFTAKRIKYNEERLLCLM